MADTYNDICTNTFVLNSALEEDLNLMRLSLDEEKKPKGCDFRCSLNELPDVYAPEALLASLKHDGLSKRQDSNFYYFMRPGNDSERNLPNLSIANFDRPELFARLEQIGSRLQMSELDIFGLEAAFNAKREEKSRFVRLMPQMTPQSNLDDSITEKCLSKSEAKLFSFRDSRQTQRRKQTLAKHKSNGIKQKQLVQCNCKKSKCLRLYCECFAKGLICGVDCNCSDCHNSSALEDLRGQVVQETLEKNPFAFRSKYKKLQNDGKKVLHSRGCNCSKTGCVKKYCECYNAGTGCSRLCRCSNCQNENIQIGDDEVKLYYDRILRKRRKSKVIESCFDNGSKALKKLKQV